MNDAVITLIQNAFANQHALNATLKPEWVGEPWKYYRAIWTEIGEAICHTNWAWWKKANYGQDLTPEQLGEVHVELCDILHFGLSLDIQQCSYVEDGVDVGLLKRAGEYKQEFADAMLVRCDLEDDLEALVVDAILMHSFNIKKFARACLAAGLSLEGLFTYYYAKSALNQFRWKNGYKAGTYVKMWKFTPDEKAVEDNTHLSAYVRENIATSTPDELREWLVTGAWGRAVEDHMTRLYASVIKPGQEPKKCSDERPCTPCFTDNGRCAADQPTPITGANRDYIKGYLEAMEDQIAAELSSCETGIVNGHMIVMAEFYITGGNRTTSLFVDGIRRTHAEAVEVIANPPRKIAGDPTPVFGGVSGP